MCVLKIVLAIFRAIYARFDIRTGFAFVLCGAIFHKSRAGFLVGINSELIGPLWQAGKFP